MMNRKCIYISLALLVVCACLIISSAFAESSAEAVLQKWLTDVRQYDLETDFLSTWSTEDQAAMLRIMEKHQISPREDAWTVAEDALSDVFAYFYGSGRCWSYVQKSEWDAARLYLGLTEEQYYIIPDDDFISEQDAYNAILNDVLDSVSKGQMPDADTYLQSEACVTSVACVLLEDEAVWWFQFYLGEDELPFLSAYVWADGKVYAEYEDRSSISDVYSAWQKERDGKKFAYWSLEDKAAFRQVLLLLRERELELYGYLPPIAQTVLGYQHAIPDENVLSEDQAIEIANQEADKLIDLQSAVPFVYFYLDNTGRYVYQVNYLTDRELVFSVLLDATNGLVITQSGQS